MASSSSSTPGSKYDVFLSFRGPDTRKTFVGYLYGFLDQRGFRTFMDDEKLDRGKSISPELIKNINESKISVVVFSKNYASSPWCLDELEEILNCRRIKGQIVLPLFYNVKPSDVRNQKGVFGKAFNRLARNHKADKVERWRAALKETADISGLDLEDEANGYEYKFVQKVLDQISEKLRCRTLQVAEHEVGIDSRVHKLIMQINERPKERLFVGICGMGGIGKTTNAKAIYNRIANEFEGSCFLGNVRERSNQHDGIAKLQEELLRETLKDNNFRISNSDLGVNEIKDRLKGKKILIVVDDVSHEKQLTSLVGIEHDWFGSGSTIIITTRDKGLLEKHNVRTYEIEELNGSEALELFSWHAFNQKQPKKEFEELSHRAKDYAKGLPLALQVLGSYLRNRSKQEWSFTLNRWKTNPPKGIHDILRLSYDGLDKEERTMFLDIACFFKGYDKKLVMEILKSCESDPVIGMQVLNERFLINISKDNKVSMHDLIQEMGKGVIRQESEKPGERSRLWDSKDVHNVFTEHTVTENIQSIVFEGEGLHASAHDFEKMKKLRLLKISGLILDRCPTYLSNELAFLEWDGYPQEYLPHNFYPKKLVQLQLRHSKLKQISLGIKWQYRLKVLNLSWSKYLEECPNFSGMPYLEELNLRGCKSLVELHPSIAFHQSLVCLDLRECKNLKGLPESAHLISLKFLYLSGCSKFEKFPEIQGPMDCLELLFLDGTAIEDLPPSVKHLKGLKFLNLKDCKMLGSLPSNICEMKSLEFLWLRGSGIKELPPSIAQLTNLTELDWESCNLDERSILNLPQYCSSLKKLFLGSNNFASLPATFTQLTKLERLYLDGCLSLRTVKSLPSSIRFVCARGCLSLEQYSIPTSEGSPDDRQWIFTDCVKLLKNHENNKPDMYSQSQLQEIGEIIIPGRDIPNWFSHIYENNVTSVRLKVDPNSGNNLKGIAVCAVIQIVAEHSKYSFFFEFDLRIDGYKKTVSFSPDAINFGFKSDHIMLSHKTNYNKPRLRPSEPDCDGFYIEASINTTTCVPLNLKKWGIHLIMEAQDEKKDEDDDQGKFSEGGPMGFECLITPHLDVVRSKVPATKKTHHHRSHCYRFTIRIFGVLLTLSLFLLISYMRSAKQKLACLVLCDSMYCI